MSLVQLLSRETSSPFVLSAGTCHTQIWRKEKDFLYKNMEEYQRVEVSASSPKALNAL